MQGILVFPNALESSCGQGIVVPIWKSYVSINPSEGSVSLTQHSQTRWAAHVLDKPAQGDLGFENQS